MLRENIYEFIKEDGAVLFVPKNGGLNEYVRGMLPEVGVDSPELSSLKKSGNSSLRVDGLELRLARGEDIPQRVAELLQLGTIAYGLTGDDLYDEFVAVNGSDLGVGLLNTYDWFDENAVYNRPALCFMNQSGSWDDVGNKVAINRKYASKSKEFLGIRGEQKGIEFQITEYSGDTEVTVKDGINDCCVEIVYGGGTRKECGLEVVDVVRFSDIVLVGQAKYTDPWAMEYQRLESRRDNPTDSYTSKTLQNPNEVTKKFGQEAAEFVQAYAQQEGLVGEALDVFYGTMLALVSSGVKWQEVENSLRQRW